ncbi:MAG: hypothetical protein K6G30_05845 [Acetatifactor sp.]|nr:hypothetical protein [Acetatifactor sp.]
MKSEKLLDAIGEVKDIYIQDANIKVSVRRTWMRWAAGAACLCAFVVGTFVFVWNGNLSPTKNDMLPQITIPEYIDDGRGFEGYICYSAEELENGNPWKEDRELETLPVYKNGCYNPSGAGEPLGLSESEMNERLTKAVERLGQTILETESETIGMMGGIGTEIPKDTVCSVRAVTVEGVLTAYADGKLKYELPEGTALPVGYHFADSGISKEEAETALEYLIKKYAALLNYDNPVITLQGEYDFSGNHHYYYIVYDAAKEYRENILNYNFRFAEFVPDPTAMQNLLLIWFTDGLAKAEKLGDYPLISVKEAKKKLLKGQYQTTVPTDMPGKDYIAKEELVYRMGPSEETMLPYYRFYVELPDTDEYQMENGLKIYGVYYVPAIRDEYIVNPPA